MKLYFCFFAVFSLGLTSCLEDSEDPTAPVFVDYDTDENIEAPVVECTEAVDLITVTTDSSPVATRVFGLAFNNEGRGLAIDRNRNFWRVTDNGETWTPFSPNLPAGQPILPYYAGDETVYVQLNHAEERPQLLRSDDDGEMFFEVNTNGIAATEFIVDLHFNTPSQGMAIVADYSTSLAPTYRLLKTTEGGLNWTEETVPGEEVMLGFTVVEGEVVVLRKDDLLVSNADGWESRPFGGVSLGRVKHISFNGQSRGLLFSTVGQLYSTLDGGRSWQLDSEDFVGVELMAIQPNGVEFILADRHRVIGGDQLVNNGMIVYERANAEQAWEIEKTSTTCSLQGYYFPTPTGRIIVHNSVEISFLDQ